MTQTPRIIASITFLTKDEGGRSQPVYANQDYRPHIVIGDPNQREALVDENNRILEHYVGVCFGGNAGEELVPGITQSVSLTLTSHPNVDDSAVQPGATFTVREGGKIVGYGVVEERAP